MLEEAHVEAAMGLLGLQHVVVGTGQSLWVGSYALSSYQPVTTAPALQIHHAGTRQHYFLSFVHMTEDYEPRVYVLDTAFSQLTPNVKAQLGALYKECAVDGELTVHMLAVQNQGPTNDCGLFAIAYAVEFCLTIGDDEGQDTSIFEEIAFDQKKMRAHLRACFVDGELTEFPRTGKPVKRQPSSIVKFKIA